MLFSVVIPTYNRLPLLKEALESLWRQTFTDYEVIVVDDGSTDGTGDFARSLGARLKLLEQANRGPGAARNLAVEHAKGDYVAFLDSDDLWFPWTLASYAECIGRFPAIQFLVGTGTFFGPGKPLTKPAGQLNCRLVKCLFDVMNEGDFALPTSAVALRRTNFLELGGFIQQYVVEDMDLWLRAGCLTGFARIDSPPMSAERRHDARLTHDLEQTLVGLAFIMEAERRGRYPGGIRYRRVRVARIARATRSVSAACLKQGRYGDAWNVYRESCTMNVLMRRWKYLFGFPLLVATGPVQSFLKARQLLLNSR